MPRAYLLPVGLVIVILIVLGLWGWVPENVSSARCQLARNAAWIDVDWTSKPIDETAVRSLAKSATERRIRYLFPYTTYVRQDGTFSPSYRYATQFVSQFRSFNHDTMLLAWVGIPLKNERTIGTKGWVDLAVPSVRREIVNFVSKLINDSKFDGVHLNAETVQNDDPSFLLLLDEMRDAIGKSKISIAGSQWIPAALNALPLIRDFRWTGGYYQQVARRVDQIATMTYDSFAPSETLYRLWMREQVRGISYSLAPSDAELLIGISVSREDTVSHHPYAENLKSGLAGMCAGLMGTSSTAQGVAIYADWEFSAADRKVCDNWQKEPGRSAMRRTGVRTAAEEVNFAP